MKVSQNKINERNPFFKSEWSESFNRYFFLTYTAELISEIENKYARWNCFKVVEHKLFPRKSALFFCKNQLTDI